MVYRIVALSAGLSVPSTTRLLTDRLVTATTEAATAAGLEMETRVIEIRELAMDVATVLVTGMPKPRVEDALDALEAADALIAVTPIFAGSYAGVFKSFMDLVGTERLAGTPVVLAATAGSARHSLAIDHAMRPLFSAMRAHTLPTGVFAATDDFGASASTPGKNEASSVQSRVERAAAEVVATLAAASLPTALSRRHQWTSPSEAAAQTARLSGDAMAVAAGEGLPPGRLTSDTSQDKVGTPGPGSMAALLKSDGTKGRLRPDMDDFVPMTQIFPT